ncbi:MAG TPA: branched-chain amino acid ABC transporter permease, partial [Anaerovoracaceae bacterium]|nr:branched-chain amino acid ABC transporter permease [Anaerovoracaceae bacterium]
MQKLNPILTNKKNIGLTVFLIILLILPFLITTKYYVHLLAVVFIYAIAAHGQNLITGYTGQFSFGHAGFLALGAYGYSLAAVNAHLGFFGSVIAGSLLAALVGTFLGIPALRMKGPYLGLATAGFGEIIRIVINNWEPVTSGPRGIHNIPKPEIFGHTLSSNYELYYLM